MWGGMHICEGAPLSPPESAAAGTLLSVCCSARRRTVLAMCFVPVWACSWALPRSMPRDSDGGVELVARGA